MLQQVRTNNNSQTEMFFSRTVDSSLNHSYCLSRRRLPGLWPLLLSTCTFQDSDLLTFNISAHHSWWGEHGPGCVRREMPQAPGVRTTDSQSYITVMGCLLDYQYIEVAHSGAQILVTVSTCKKCKYATGTHNYTLNLRNNQTFPLFSVLRQPNPKSFHWF